MELEISIIFVGCFAAALVNSALATGGVYITLAASSAVLPLSAAIPMQGILAAPSLVARIVLFRRDIDWSVAFRFVPTAALGAIIGVWIFVQMHEALISLFLGGLLLVLVWGLPQAFNLNAPRRFLAIGTLHGFFSTILGVGLFLQPALLRTAMTRLQITGTLAVCLMGMEVVKAGGYVQIGFDYAAYLPHILAGSIAGIGGSLLGRRLGNHLSESLFRTIFKWLVTMAGLRLLIKGGFDLLGGWP